VPRELRQGEMIAAALPIFGERGYHAASMDEIATAAGITKPMLYAYFDSKQGLFAACAEILGERLRERVAAVGRAELPADQRLWLGLVAVFDFIAEHRNTWRVLYPPQGHPQAGPIGDAAQHGRAAMSDLMVDLLRETAIGEGVAANAAAEVAPLAHALTAATLAGAEWWLAHPKESGELQALRLMNLTWAGFDNLLRGRMWLPQA